MKPAKIPVGGTAIASVEVTHKGGRASAEPAQLYVRDELRNVTRPVKELKGFERGYLEPGESKTVRFETTPACLELRNPDLKRVVEPGWFEVMIGDSSARTVPAKLVGQSARRGGRTGAVLD